MPHPEYKINDLHDFLKVPEDRRAACLEEFLEYLRLIQKIENAAGVFARFTRLGVLPIKHDGFTWVDDGEKNKTVRVKVA